MAEKNVQRKAEEKDKAPKDEYYGGYKSAREGVSEAERWATNQNPVRETKTPWKNLKQTGG